MMLRTLKTLSLILLCQSIIGMNCLMTAQDNSSSVTRQIQNEKLQRIICDLHFGNAYLRIEGFHDIQLTGGWFAIKTLSRFLEDEPQNDQGSSDSYGIHAGPRFYTLQVLAKIVPEAPLGPPSGMLAYDPSGSFDPSHKGTAWYAGVWKQWLAKNHDRLVQLEPQGEGITSSPEVCRAVWQQEIHRIKEISGSGRFNELKTMLARDEQPEQLRQLACEVTYGIPELQYATIEQLRSVGGWFSIRLLSQFLQDDLKQKADPKIDARSYVLETLPWVVPNPPFPRSKGSQVQEWSASELASWRGFLESNHDSLVKLRPIGEGIAVDESTCIRVLKNDPASVALTRQSLNPSGSKH